MSFSSPKVPPSLLPPNVTYVTMNWSCLQYTSSADILSISSKYYQFVNVYNNKLSSHILQDVIKSVIASIKLKNRKWLFK